QNNPKDKMTNLKDQQMCPDWKRRRKVFLCGGWVAGLVFTLITARASDLEWGATNANTIGNWTVSTSWPNAAVPTSGDNVIMPHVTKGPWTNVVDGPSVSSIQDIIFRGNVDDGNATAGLGVNTLIPVGQTLSVLGTNGFYLYKTSLSAAGK